MRNHHSVKAKPKTDALLSVRFSSSCNVWSEPRIGALFGQTIKSGALAGKLRFKVQTFLFETTRVANGLK